MTTTLDLDNGRQITMTHVADPRTGTVTYHVTGVRLTGAFTLFPHRWSADPYPTAVTVQYGVGDTRHGLRDRPVVNGVTVSGSTVVETAEIDQFTQWRCRAERHNDPAYRFIPTKGVQYVAAVIRALVRHRAALPELDQLREAAARHQATSRLRSEEDNIAQLRTKLDPLLDQLTEREQRAAQLRKLAAEHADQAGDA